MGRNPHGRAALTEPGPILVKAIEEASGRLVGPPVFKTGEGSKRPLAGSIPVRLRQPHDNMVIRLEPATEP